MYKAQPRLQVAIDATSPSLSRHGVVPEGRASGGSPRPGLEYVMICPVGIPMREPHLAMLRLHAKADCNNCRYVSM